MQRKVAWGEPERVQRRVKNFRNFYVNSFNILQYPTALPALILAGKVILSSVVKLELLAGVRRQEANQLKELLSGLAVLDDFPPTAICQSLLARARGRGLLGGLPDIMILSDCYRSAARLMTTDTKLKALARELKIKIHEID